jgi:hypothetical protein
MKKGVAGVRLCDQSGCYERWPCARHGTITAQAHEASGTLRRGYLPISDQARALAKVCRVNVGALWLALSDASLKHWDPDLSPDECRFLKKLMQRDSLDD